MSETFTLTPASYSATDSVILTNPENMMQDTSSTTYCEFYNTSSSASNQSVALHFDLIQLPFLQSVTSWAFKIKFGCESYRESWYSTAYLYRAPSASLKYYTAQYGTTIWTISSSTQDGTTWNDIINGADETYPFYKVTSEYEGGYKARIYGAELQVVGERVPKIFNLILPRG